MFIATSAGEIGSIEPLLSSKGIERSLIFTTSLTGRNRQGLPSGHEIRYLPYPFFLPAFWYILSKKPSRVVMVEHEIWPAWILVPFIAGVPVILVQARKKLFPDGPSALPGILFPLFNKIVYIDGEETMPARWKTRFGNALFWGKDIKLFKKPTASPDKSGTPLIIFASTHRDEESLFLETVKNLLPRLPAIFHIVPRHPERIAELKDACDKSQLKYTLFSQKGLPAAPVSASSVDSRLILGDRFGILGELYSAATVTVMGGTFREHGGGHNVWEPLQYRCYCISGPFLRNLRPEFNRAAALGLASDANDENLHDILFDMFQHAKKPAVNDPFAALFEDYDGAERETKRLIFGDTAE